MKNYSFAEKCFLSFYILTKAPSISATESRLWRQSSREVSVLDNKLVLCKMEGRIPTTIKVVFLLQWSPFLLLNKDCAPSLTKAMFPLWQRLSKETISTVEVTRSVILIWVAWKSSRIKIFLHSLICYQITHLSNWFVYFKISGCLWAILTIKFVQNVHLF